MTKPAAEGVIKEMAPATKTPLTALVVSSDQSLQRRLHQYLSETGYRSLHTASVEHALALIEATSCHFLIVDAELQQGDALELCREAGTLLRGGPIAKLLLQPNISSVEFADLLHAGVDDVLMKPINYLELVARLRAAARTHEFRRRVATGWRMDPITKLADENSFRLQLEQLLRDQGGQVHSCIALKIDHFQQKRACDGAAATEALLAALADYLRRDLLDFELLSHWGESKFVLVCGGQGLNEIGARAEELCESLVTAMAEFQLSFPITISAGVADLKASTDAPELIKRSLAALHVAQTSGGGCIVRHGDHNDELSQLREEHRTGHVFQKTVAADLMTPCVLTLGEAHGVWHATNLLHKHRLAAAPLVDGSGKCVGIIEQINMPVSADKAGNQSVSSFRSPHAEMCPEETVLSDIMQRFSESETQWLVITRHARPTGIICRDQLADFSQPMSLETLAPADPIPVEAKVADMLVPEFVA